MDLFFYDISFSLVTSFQRKRKDQEGVRSKCWRSCQEKETLLLLLVEMYIGVATMENSMEVPQKFLNRTTRRSGSPTSECISKGNENRMLKRCSLQRYSQQPRYRNLLSVVQKMKG